VLTSLPPVVLAFLLFPIVKSVNRAVTEGGEEGARMEDFAFLHLGHVYFSHVYPNKHN
jgi:hypothetical protein